MSHVHSQKIRRAFYVAGILTGMFFVPEMLVDAANLMVTIPSNYSSSIMGTITGSRVTTTVNGTPKAVRTKNLNGDPGVFNINVQGQSKIFLRQYTYSTSEGSLKANEILDADGDFNIANASGKLINAANPHMGILPRLIPVKATALQSPLNRTSVIPGLNSRSAVPGRLAVPRSSMQISPAALAATMKCSGN